MAVQGSKIQQKFTTIVETTATLPLSNLVKKFRDPVNLGPGTRGTPDLLLQYYHPTIDMSYYNDPLY